MFSINKSKCGPVSLGAWVLNIVLILKNKLHNFFYNFQYTMFATRR